MADQNTVPGAQPANEQSGVAAVQTGDFTPAQLATMAETLVVSGKLTKDQADEALAADGIAPLVEKVAASPEAAAIDGAFPPASKPEDYQLPLIVGPNERYTPEIAAMDAQFRGWMMTARLPASIGSALAAEINKVAEQHAAMTDNEKQLYQITEKLKLDKMWGDKAPAKIAQAGRLLYEIEAKRPGIVDLIAKSGAGNSAFVIAQIVLHAERLAARKA